MRPSGISGSLGQASGVGGVCGGRFRNGGDDLSLSPGSESTIEQGIHPRPRHSAPLRAVSDHPSVTDGQTEALSKHDQFLSEGFTRKEKLYSHPAIQPPKHSSCWTPRRAELPHTSCSGRPVTEVSYASGVTRETRCESLPGPTNLATI